MQQLGDGMRLVHAVTGVAVMIHALHEADEPTVTLVATCEGCGAELVRREFSVYDDPAQVTAYAVWDCVGASPHRCGKAAPC